jgi:hypothetical protein
VGVGELRTRLPHRVGRGGALRSVGVGGVGHVILLGLAARRRRRQRVGGRRARHRELVGVAVAALVRGATGSRGLGGRSVT